MNKQIIIAVCLITTLALGLFIIFPKYNNYKSKQIEVGAKETELQNIKAYYDKIAQNSEELKKYSPQISQIDSALPPEVNEPSMYYFFQNKASESGLIFKDGKMSSNGFSKENPAIKEYDFSLSLSGSYAAFKNFLSALENSARLIEIESISFSSPSSPEKKDSSFQIDLLTKFYSY